MVQSEIAKVDVLCLHGLAGERPRIDRVIKALLVEVAAGDWALRPDLVVSVSIVGVVPPLSVLSLLRPHDFLPLVHLDDTFESVRIVRRDKELMVGDALLVLSLPNAVDQEEVVHFVSLLDVDCDDFFGGPLHTPGIGDQFLLVFPEEHNREWD